MSFPLISRAGRLDVCLGLLVCLLPGLLVPSLLIARTDITEPARLDRRAIALEWLRASGLEGLSAAFAGMLHESLPGGCRASAVADPETLAVVLARNLADAMPPDLPAAVTGWLESETAARVREAESSLAGLDEATYERLRATHQAELSNGSPRLAQIRTVIEKTQAARLETVIFNELELRERLFAHCGDSEALQALWTEIGEVSAGDDLVSFFFRFSLAESTLLMFRDLAPRDLDAYVTFVESPAGLRWHTLLVDSVEHALFEDRARFYHALTQ